MNHLDDAKLDEQLSAYIDNELGPEDKRAIEALIETDPVVNDRYRALSALDNVLMKTFDEINQVPLPDAVTKLVDENNKQRSLRDYLRQVISVFEFQRTYVYAFSAVFMLILALPVFLTQNSDSTQNLKANLWLTEGGVLAETLSGTASGEKQRSKGLEIEVSYSFVAKNGLFCREFAQLGGGQRQTGIACRDLQKWKVVFASETAVISAEADYITASSEDSGDINDFVEDMIDGEILSLTEESGYLMLPNAQ